VLLDIELRLEDPSCVAYVPTPPGLKRLVELDVPLVMVLPVPMLDGDVPVVVFPIAVPGHVAPVKVVLVPETGPGLMPGVASSVAPMGIPVGPIDAPELIPSGEVEPIPGPAPGTLICAWPGP
jgi:hypothetical protein